MNMHERPRPEQEPATDAYARVARYDGGRAEREAERAYQRSRRDLHRAPKETDLSIFRLQIGNLIGDVAYLGWYVALIGSQPDEALEARLDRNLAGGTAVKLPEVVLSMLRARRERNAEVAPWIERRHGQVTRAEADLYRRPEGEEREGVPPERR